MESMRLLTSDLVNMVASTGRRYKVNGHATAALLIQIASEMLETSPTLRKHMGVTLTDLAAAEKVGKGLIRNSQPVN